MYNFNEKQLLSDFLENNFFIEDLIKTTKEKYNIYKKIKNNKARIIEAPSDKRKSYQKKINAYSQKNIICPKYCFSGWKGKNNILNAKEHLGQNYYLTADIERYYTNSTSRHVIKWAEQQGLEDIWAKLFTDLTTCNGHLSTGSPASMVLATLIHKEIFDEIQQYSMEQSIKFTLYVDDITLSGNKPISQDCIRYIEKLLYKHDLKLNRNKIKRFGYKGAHITGIRLTKNKRLDIPFKKNYEIIKILSAKDISAMTLKEVRLLLGKIGYIQQIYPNRFKTTKFKAIAQLKKLT